MAIHIGRRDFITLVAVGGSPWPLAAWAQQPSMPMIGDLDSPSSEAVANRLRGLCQGLKESGYIENEKLAIAYRCSEGQSERLPGPAAFHDPLRFHLHS